jgi:hypothetical protein
MLKDLWLSSEGDLELGPDGDFRVAQDDDVRTQSAALRIKTEPGEVILHPEIGTGLETLIGKRLSEENLAYGEQLIKEAITFDGNFEPSSVAVRGVPLNSQEIVFVVEVATSGLRRSIALAIPFDFNYGIVTSGIRAVGDSSVYGSTEGGII